jgi:hypothetical protein
MPNTAKMFNGWPLFCPSNKGVPESTEQGTP